MAIRTDITQTDTASLNAIKELAIKPQTLDSPSDQPENYYYDSDFSENLGYYRTTQLKAPIDTLAIWTIGKGYTVESKRTEVILESLTGWGTDDFIDIMFNHMVMTKISKIGGMAQIIKNANPQIFTGSGFNRPTNGPNLSHEIYHSTKSS